MPDNLTQHERLALSGPFNLADGHARQTLSPEQSNIVSRLGEIYRRCEHADVDEIEQLFVNTFLCSAGQRDERHDGGGEKPLLVYSASQAIELAAHVLRTRVDTVGVVTPTFDNIPDIVRRVGLRALPISETECLDELLGAIGRLRGQALFLVQPNNPTGQLYSAEALTRVFAACKANDVVLVVDFSFRFFSDDLGAWRQYDAAIRSGASFLFIEDTGKTWPTLDLKVGMLTASQNLQPTASRVHNDFLLNVSPFTLAVLTQFIDTSRRSGMRDFRDAIDANRRMLRSHLVGTPLQTESETSTTSVELLRLNDGSSARVLLERLVGQGVHLLPGAHFYWHDQLLGYGKVRVALARPADQFAQGVRRIRVAVTGGV